MKSLNGKRIAAVAAGAALLGLGLAFAGPVSFQSVPIISNSGQPVVQVVIGSTAKPSDGAAAANIAAAIGNLAYTSVPVTATVNMTQASKVLHAVLPSNAGYSLSNVGVYLNESSTAYVSGTYSFGALIGSVLNGAVQLSAPASTKAPQTADSYVYTANTPYSTSISPAQSPYTSAGYVPFSSVSASNGGGVAFSSFANNGYDNIMEVTNAQLPSLMNNAGTYGESEYLWLTGFPVYNQQKSNFQLQSAGGAYQVTFNKPISYRTSSNSINDAAITLLGENWTIINYELPGTTSFNSNTGSNIPSTSTAIPGGEIQLASSLSPLTTLYVGQNITTGPFKVELTDLGQPNQNAISVAAFNIYYNNVLTNVTSIFPNDTAQLYNVSGHNLYVKVSNTFAGLYAYQKYAKVQLYANVYNVTNAKAFNTTNDNGWSTTLLWTNTSSNTIANQLYSIILYNTTPTTLTAGQSLSFIQNPSKYKLTFVGESLGSANFDPVTATLSTGSETYANSPGSVSHTGNINNITEPAQLLTVSSSISNAFTNPAGQVSSSVLYDLTPYKLTESATGNTLAGNANVILNELSGNFVSPTNKLTVTISGYPTSSASGPVTTSVTFNSPSQTVTAGEAFYNITAIQLQSNRALPGLTVNVIDGASTSMASLTTLSPEILYSQTGKSYLQTITGAVTYNQQNGQPTSSFGIGSATPSNTITSSSEFFSYTMNEIAVPSQASYVDQLAVDIYNSTTGAGASPLFQLNTSTSGKNSLVYTATSQTGGASVNASVGFRTERGSKVASISPGSVTVDFAKSVDNLMFAVGPSSTTAATSTEKMYGPYGIGQSTNIPNVSIAKVTANITVSSSSGATVAGISNLTATPSVSVATTPVLLNNLPTSPLVVLDSAANPSSNLILVGSGYVNTLSQQLETSQGISITSTSAPITQAYGTNRILVAGYTANQTTAAANTFIQDLYANAASST